MQPVKRTCIILLGITLQLCYMATGTTQAQNAPADAAVLQRQIAHAVAAYNKAVGVQTHLYNGTEYVDYKKAHFEGDQFFISKAASHGNVFYDGTWFTKVPVLYDIVTDELVATHNSSGLMMKLISGKIDTFHVHGHTFVRLQEDSAGEANLQSGFYDLLYSGGTQFLVRRIKEMQDRATPDGMEGEFRVGDKLYIRKDGKYHQVSSKASVYRVFKDKKKQLQKFASSRRLKFRKQKEETILALASYYDSLSASAPQNRGN